MSRHAQYNSLWNGASGNVYAANYNGIFGPVCDSTGVPWHLWGKEEAEVVCRFFNIFFRLATRPCGWVAGIDGIVGHFYILVLLLNVSLRASGAQLGLDDVAEIRFGRF